MNHNGLDQTKYIRFLSRKAGLQTKILMRHRHNPERLSAKNILAAPTGKILTHKAVTHPRPFW
jgi:hypothetical protein